MRLKKYVGHYSFNVRHINMYIELAAYCFVNRDWATFPSPNFNRYIPEGK